MNELNLRLCPFHQKELVCPGAMGISPFPLTSTPTIGGGGALVGGNTTKNRQLLFLYDMSLPKMILGWFLNFFLNQATTIPSNTWSNFSESYCISCRCTSQSTTSRASDNITPSVGKLQGAVNKSGKFFNYIKMNVTQLIIVRFS